MAQGGPQDGRSDDHPVPDAARTPREFTDMLRRLKAASGLSFRQISTHARNSGQYLPHSTLASALARDTLPSEEIVVALVRACGVEDDEIEAWTAARTRLAVGEPSAPAAPVARPSRLLVFAGIGLVVLLIAAVVTIVLLVRRPAGDTATAADRKNPGLAVVKPGRQPLPASGRYLIRAAGTERCLSERPEDREGTGKVYLRDCTKAIVVAGLEKVTGASYQIKAQHPKFGPGCLGFDQHSEIATNSGCGERDVEHFRLAPVEKPVRGFRIMLPDGNLCATVGRPSPGAHPPLLRTPCRPTGSGQIFTFEPA